MHQKSVATPPESPCELPTPHGSKLRTLLSNPKLPEADRPLIGEALQRYSDWLSALSALPYGEKFIISDAINLLNDYRFYLDINVIFDSSNDFLYRQKGQLKLENSVIEEFLPHLVVHYMPSLCETNAIGPTQTFSSLYFDSKSPGNLTSIKKRLKAQDFAIYQKVQILVTFLHTNISHKIEVSVGHLCAECKTNLDKTMFQEAASTALDVKGTLPSAKYLLLCEWLDMTPISTAGFAIDEVLILRKARRLQADVRQSFNTAAGRQKGRDLYVKHLLEHPFSTDVFARFLWHIKNVFHPDSPVETSGVLEQGYF